MNYLINYVILHYLVTYVNNDVSAFQTCMVAHIIPLTRMFIGISQREGRSIALIMMVKDHNYNTLYSYLNVQVKDFRLCGKWEMGRANHCTD